jgi:hypothetical protein
VLECGSQQGSLVHTFISNHMNTQFRLAPYLSEHNYCISLGVCMLSHAFEVEDCGISLSCSEMGLVKYAYICSCGFHIESGKLLAS